MANPWGLSKAIAELRKRYGLPYPKGLALLNPLILGKRWLGSQNERALLEFQPLVDLINSLESKIQRLSDHQLRAKTDEFKERVKAKEGGVKPELERLEEQFAGSTVPEEKEKIKVRMKEVRNRIFEEVLPEAFAVVREAARRTIRLRHFDVQLMGGIVLHQGKIAEMVTGEGKTLVATLPVYLNALTGDGTHVVTVNDYLARRDREWMGPIYEFLGLSCGVIQHDQADEERTRQYACDVTYGTNNEFGFDYLRDNMKFRKEDMAQRGHNYIIVDEVDSILIDEARTPLIISGPAEESTDKYYIINRLVPKLKGRSVTEAEKIDAKYKGVDLSEGFDYIVDEKAGTVELTEQGVAKSERLLDVKNLYDDIQSEWVHHIRQALRAHSSLFERDVHYLVKDGEVVIVDEFTGRMMPGRRWSDGLHQAIEAKEGVAIKRENQTLATITLQNYFRMYKKLAGMTGTAATEAMEFGHIYKLDVVVIPTNRPLIRTNFADAIYKTESEKFNAVVAEIEELYRKGRPVLVGTISIDKSERFSHMLKRKNIPHNVLNAKYHELEAHIVAQAGRLNAVTIATNMAGRGTDILLGGNPEYLANDLITKQVASGKALSEEQRRRTFAEIEAKVAQEHEGVVKLGGLHIVGTERHEARRIDNQLRGRAGRQGDPGSSRFYLSLEDDLMRIFGSDRIAGLMDRLGMEEGQEIQHPLVTRAIETAQKRVEAMNFDTRRWLLEYDNIMNRQREVIYDERRLVLEGEDPKGHIFEMIDDCLTSALSVYANASLHREDWDLKELARWLRLRFPIRVDDLNLEVLSHEEMKRAISERITDAYTQKEKAIGEDVMRHLEKSVVLQVIDSRWKDHLYAMDKLKEGIHLRAYGQRDPLVEFQHEGFQMFADMTHRIKEEVVEFIFKVQVIHEERRVGVLDALAREFLHPEARRMASLPAGGPLREQAPEAAAGRPLRAPSLPPEAPAPGPPTEKPAPYMRERRKIGRNEPCPCGSGKKYKHCCGR